MEVKQGYSYHIKDRFFSDVSDSSLMKLKWTVGTGVALGATLRPAIAFEETFAGLRKVRDMSDAEAERMKRNLLDISTRIPMTGEALTQIAVSAAQMGIKSEQAILNFTAAAAKMGVAFDIPAEEAGRAMAEIRNSSGLTHIEDRKSVV